MENTNNTNNNNEISDLSLQKRNNSNNRCVLEQVTPYVCDDHSMNYILCKDSVIVFFGFFLICGFVNMIYGISGIKRGFNDVFDCVDCNGTQSSKKRRKLSLTNDNDIKIKFDDKQQIQTKELLDSNDQKLQGTKRRWVTQDRYVCVLNVSFFFFYFFL